MKEVKLNFSFYLLRKWLRDKKRIWLHIRSLNPWTGNWNSLAEANRAIGSVGYRQNYDSFVKYCKSLDGIEVDGADMRILGALKSIDAKSVLDVGGGLGNRYLSLRKNLNVKWTVLELPEMVELGRRTFPEINFVTDDRGGGCCSVMRGLTAS
jgi:putative methyltransferase (TIGR04325 family)